MVVTLHSSATIVLSSTSVQQTLPVSIKLPDGVEMVMPGDNVELEVDLITPIAMEKTMRFAIREGGRTVGAGRVGEILD